MVRYEKRFSRRDAKRSKSASEIAGMGRAVISNESLDCEQGEKIEKLEKENRELKLYLATLVRLLVGKGVLKPEEVETTVKAIET